LTIFAGKLRVSSPLQAVEYFDKTSGDATDASRVPFADACNQRDFAMKVLDSYSTQIVQTFYRQRMDNHLIQTQHVSFLMDSAR